MSGAVAALPIWRAIAEDGLETGWLQKGETFKVPPGVTVKDIDYQSGLLASGGRVHQGSLRRRHRARPGVQLPVVHDHQPALVSAEGVLHPEGRGEDARQVRRGAERDAGGRGGEATARGAAAADEGQPPP